MTDEDANRIIETVMKVHWPKWEFKGQELRVWIEELRKFDYENAKYAINELYKTWDSIRYPKMPTIMGAIRKLSHARRPKKRQCRLYTIIRSDGRRRWWPFWGNANAPRQAIETDAEIKRDAANRMWPENHPIQYHSTEDPEADKAEEPDEPGKQEQDEIPF